MSSFVGLLRFDGAPCDPSVIEAMLGRLSHRVTPDGARRASVRCRGSVGLGCAVLPTTPQARRELEQPDAHQVLREGDRELWIASDGRLDNRDEIIGALGAGEAREWSDGRLMLAAYARWGEASVRRLRGDFAYAIWDQTRQNLFCARDRFGVKPFYYAHVPGQFFAFASEIKALWCVPALDSSVNPAQIADYLASQFRDKTSTFYRNAHRLAPAHWMKISRENGEARPQLYWELDEQSELTLDGNARANDEEYARRVRASFDESLDERMSCDGKLAAFLSGGLDSSSIAALAERKIEDSHQPLTTFSTIFERFAQCDERAYIDQTLARGDFAPLWMNGDDISPFEGIERIVWHLDGPSSAPNICSAWAQYRHLQEAGISVVLDGHGGDEVVCMGYERVSELLRHGHFAAAWHEIGLLHRHGVTQQAPALQMWSALLWHARDKRGWGRLTRSVRRRHVRRIQEADTTQQLLAHSLGVIAPQTLALLEDEQAAPSHKNQSVRQHHAETLATALQPLALEGIDAMSGAHALETRCPFWEQQLVQLCVSLPADQKMREGHNRYVMRRAMEGILAPGVQWRRNKTDFGPQITTVLRERETQRLDRFFGTWEQIVPALEPYIDMERAHSHWQALQNAPAGSGEAVLYSTVLWKIFSLGTWLVAPPASSTAPRSPFL